MIYDLLLSFHRCFKFVKNVVQKLQRISGDVAAAKRAKLKTDDTIKKDYHNALHNLNSTFLSQVGTVQIPLNPKWVVTTLRVEKCGYMSSKMAPLWLVFNNADPTGDTIIVMFKSGDDLRQDILTLQLLRVMDKVGQNHQRCDQSVSFH